MPKAEATAPFPWPGGAISQVDMRGGGVLGRAGVEEFAGMGAGGRPGLSGAQGA